MATVLYLPLLGSALNDIPISFHFSKKLNVISPRTTYGLTGSMFGHLHFPGTGTQEHIDVWAKQAQLLDRNPTPRLLQRQLLFVRLAFGSF